MSMTDPVADYLTRIRNAQGRLKKFVDIPCSNLKKRISYILIPHPQVKNPNQ